ncbi:MAG: putative DNA binding domain-containing protein [Oscillospiraceae bacterium]|nr:putative DNA binding domain-containing protein [Oscillospiraceae bacterium]
MKFESENIEYKSVMTDDIYKSVIAFANTSGGTIYVGVDDNGNVVDIDNIDDVYTRVTNSIRDTIAPDITMFIKYKLNDNKTISIDIAEGTAKPYYIKSKGIKPSGVFVRQGASSVPASPEQIRQMIKLSDGDNFETSRSLNQELSFDTARSVFSKHGIEFTEDKFSALGIVNLNDRLYTNLALIASDQCEHTVKIAVFADNANTIFKAHKEFGGSVFKQIEDAFEYLMLCNQNKSVFKGVNRIDSWDYPEEAIREALINAVVHRDYSYSGSIIVNVNDLSMEFVSLGGLLPGLSADDIGSGISQPRNRNLANMLHRLNYIESYGTGIRRIFSLYADCANKPVIEITTNTFKIILPNMNSVSPEIKESATIKPQWQTVIDYLKEHDEITEEGLQKLLDLKKTRVYTLSKQMEKAGIIVISGRGEDKKYRLK